MKVIVEWMDGRKKSYSDVVKVSTTADNILRLHGAPKRGEPTFLAEIPTFHVREWTRSG